ncbi:rab11 family-interacting protein 4A [Vespa crabro]|uniref:rab11 family-interacting protein 4A n=1 Tax=Vespa crabro TaxID=7445 RepID=UPI001F02287B|nr:rab11 family-interacting protein 4A [Vespa crabro]XP_046826819.1 rab11 family-interacting protein 4A [Vespa crabro]XP_046826820.1 rab11 family-interacting protein 4A [Vespa crabro]XP_046826822.1 rab11 family-interacting protein 4A [Vespa crabro]
MVSSRSSSTAIDDKNEENEEKKRREKEEEEEEEEGVNGGNNRDHPSLLSTVEVLDIVGEATSSAISPRKKQNFKSVDKDEGKGKGGRRTNAAIADDDDDDDDAAATTAAAEWGRRSNSGPPPSLSMSLDLQNHPIGSASPQNDSGDYSNIGSGGTGGGDGDGGAGNGPGPVSDPDPLIITETNNNNNNNNNNNALSSCNIKLIGNNREEEESYEGFGFGSDFGSSSGFGSVEVDADVEPEDSRDDADSPGGSSSAPSPTGSNPFSRNPRSPNSTIGRHSWLRTSLRRTPPCSGRKRISSNALASQLYRSGSFNSSGRGSNCDNTDDMYSDVSLEEDFIDLNHRVQMIQEQMHALADTQSVGEERYARVKQENATLQARILMLEEAAKDAETRAEERLQAEQRRHRELASRLEREKQLQLENYAIKLQAIELESSSLRDEIGRLREQLERVKNDKASLEIELKDSQSEANTARENEKQAVARANEAHHMLQVAKEELIIRADNQQRLEELEQQVIHLQARNKSLEETRDELQAAAAVQAGRELLMLNPCSNGTEKGPSLAAELLAGMSQDQMDGHAIEEYEPPYSISELKQALKEQQEVNAQLRAYIDGILLNIVENYPQLLEVKQAH